ncbi:MAG: hypothetical protein WAV90_19220 [Gordonia amarae]
MADEVIPDFARSYVDPMGRTQYAVDGPKGTWLITRDRDGASWEVWASDTTRAVCRSHLLANAFERAASHAGLR